MKFNKLNKLNIKNTREKKILLAVYFLFNDIVYYFNIKKKLKKYWELYFICHKKY